MSHSRRAPDPFPGAKQIRAKPLNRWNPSPVTRDPEKLPAGLPATREFGTVEGIPPEPTTHIRPAR